MPEQPNDPPLEVGLSPDCPTLIVLPNGKQLTEAEVLRSMTTVERTIYHARTRRHRRLLAEHGIDDQQLIQAAAGVFRNALSRALKGAPERS